MDKNKNHTSSIVRFEQRKIKVSVVIANKKRWTQNIVILSTSLFH